MAIVIYPKGRACMWNDNNGIGTDDERGVSFEVSTPDPDGLRQRERKVINVKMFDWNCQEPWEQQEVLTTVQAREIGRWLCRRAREDRRAEFKQKVYRLLGLDRL